jgi:hypothetical protein
MGLVFGKAVPNYISDKALRGLQHIPPHNDGIYTIREMYANYLIYGNIEVTKRNTIEGTIKYIKRTENSQGMASFLYQLQLDAKEHQCSLIKVEFDQCSKDMSKALRNAAGQRDFTIVSYPRISGNEILNTDTGPNITVEYEMKNHIPTFLRKHHNDC